MRLGELRSSNPLRIPHPKIDKLACQAQGVGILAIGEITLHMKSYYWNPNRKLSTTKDIIPHLFEKNKRFLKFIFSFFSAGRKKREKFSKFFSIH